MSAAAAAAAAAAAGRSPTPMVPCHLTESLIIQLAVEYETLEGQRFFALPHHLGCNESTNDRQSQASMGRPFSSSIPYSLEMDNQSTVMTMLTIILGFLGNTCCTCMKISPQGSDACL
jgi:hypothetical protein